jgi:hypothetical protein
VGFGASAPQFSHFAPGNESAEPETDFDSERPAFWEKL